MEKNNSNNVIRCMTHMIETWWKREIPTQPLPTWSRLFIAIASVDLSTAERIAADKRLHIIHKGIIYL